MKTTIHDEQIIFTNPGRPVKVGGATLPACQLCKMHFHPELEFLYVQNGTIVCYTGDDEVTLKSGDVFFINSKTPHYTKATVNPTTYSFIQFRNPTSIKGPLSYLSRFMNRSETSSYFFKAGTEENTEILGYISALLRENENKDFSYDFFITANAYLIISLLHRKRLLPVPETFAGQKTLGKLLPIFDYISENYSENITLETLSRVTNLNKSYLCRVFKKATGRTVIDYINFVRICKAEKLLKTDMNISDVAYQVGFSTLSHFNHIFKRYNRCPPSEYRKMQNRDDGLIPQNTEN